MRGGGWGGGISGGRGSGSESGGGGLEGGEREEGGEEQAGLGDLSERKGEMRGDGLDRREVQFNYRDEEGLILWLGWV